MKTVDLIHGSLTYVDPKDPNSDLPVLLKDTVLEDYETHESRLKSEYINSHPILSKVSTRNSNNAYIVKNYEDTVFINFIPRKQFVTDSSLDYVITTDFEFYTPNVPPVFVPYALSEGMIFRPLGQGIKDKRGYKYYIYLKGMIHRIPNYETLQVLLYERNLVMDSIKVLEEKYFDENVYNQGGDVPKTTSRRSEWSEEIELEVDIELAMRLRQEQLQEETDKIRDDAIRAMGGLSS